MKNLNAINGNEESRRRYESATGMNYQHLSSLMGPSAEAISSAATHEHAVQRMDLCYLRGERARKIVTRSRFRSTGKFPSHKMRRMIQWESRSELAAFHHLESDPCVQGYWEQPCIVSYSDGAQIRKHYPDICVHYLAHKELWEIKPVSQLAEQELVWRTDLLAPGLLDFGFDYRVVFDETLMEQPRYANIQLLLRHCRKSFSLHEYEEIRLIALERGRLTWGEAASGLYGPEKLALLSTLTIRGILSVDLCKGFEDEASFRFIGERS